MLNSTNILSGAIESYCLGLLSCEEHIAIEQELLKNDFLKQRVEEAGDILEAYLLANAVAPPAAIKAMLFENSRFALKGFNHTKLVA